MTVAFDPGEVVRRARAGDQNAMAVIAVAREQATKGSRKAKESLDAIVSYIKTHPADMPFRRPVPSFGIEAVNALQMLDNVVPKKEATTEDRTYTLEPAFIGLLLVIPSMGGVDAFFGAAVILADGPALTKERVEDASTMISGELERRTFLAGVNYGANSEGIDVAKNMAPMGRPYFNAGRIIGTAKGIQCVRSGGPISIYDQCAGWELGE